MRYENGGRGVWWTGGRRNGGGRGLRTVGLTEGSCRGNRDEINGRGE